MSSRWRAALALSLLAILAATAGVAAISSRTRPTGHIRRLQGHLGAIPALRYSADGRRLLSGSWDHTVRLWEARTGKTLGAFTGSQREINDVALSPDGSQAAAASEDGSILRWDTRSGQPLRPTLTLRYGAVHVAYSPDGRTLAASGRRGGVVQLWDARTCRPVSALAGHRGNTIPLAFSADGRMLATADDTAIRLWHVADGTMAVTIPLHSALWLCFSPDGRHLAVCGTFTGPVLCDTQTGQVTHRYEQPEAYAAAFSPDGATLLSAAGGEVALWDVPTGRRRATPVSASMADSFPDPLLRLVPRLREWQRKPIGSLALAPDGRSIAYSTENTIHIRPLP